MRVSAIVCSYNRKAFLIKCMDSLVNQDYDDYEVIVVDDGSTDGTDRLVEDYKKKLQPDMEFKYIQHKTNRGLGAARNTGVKNAQGYIIAFTDDDTVVDRDWVQNIVKCFDQSNGISAAGGIVINGNKDNVISEIGQQIVTDHLYEKQTGNGYTRFLVGNNQSYQKKAIEDIGYFEEDLIYGGEEAEIQARLLEAGHKMVFSPDISVTHYQRSTFRSLMKQYYRYGINLYVFKSKNSQVETNSNNESDLVVTIIDFIKKPYRISKYLNKSYEKILCYPIVTLASLARITGFFAARLGAR